MISTIIICFIFTFFPAASYVILGISQCRSKEPVGFWAGRKPPSKESVADIAAYNKKHGIMFILYGAGIVPAVMFSVIMIEMTDVALWICVAIAETVGGLLLMIRYHQYLERKYVIQQTDKP